MPSFLRPSHAGFTCGTARRRERIFRLGIDTNSRRRHPETRVLLKEVRCTQHNANRFSRHDREILSTREMRQAELHVADNIGVLDVLIALRPVGDGRVVRVSLRTVRLTDIVTSWEELVVLVRSNPEGLAGEGCTLPDGASGLGEHGGTVVIEDLVADGLFGDGVHAVRVDDVPRAVSLEAVVCGTLERCTKGCLLAVEAIAVGILWGADGGFKRDGVALDDRVVLAVDFRVDAKGEQVLVVVGGDGGGNFRAEGSSGFGWVHAVGVQHTGKLHL